MPFLFASIAEEASKLLYKINSLGFDASSIEDLRNGVVISQVLSLSHKQEDFLGIFPGKSKEIQKNNWDLILKVLKFYYPGDFEYVYPIEITEDTGVLLLICITILNRFYTPKTSYSSPKKAIKNTEHEVSLMYTTDTQKNQIHKWLQGLRLLPPGVFMHEFLYRIRSGLSLLLNKLEGKKKVVDVIANPKDITDCIKNLNHILRYLRNLNTVNNRCLWTSDSLYEGNKEIVYCLLVDIKEYFSQNSLCLFHDRIRQSLKQSSVSKSIEFVSKSISITSTMKKNLIEWLSKLELLHLVYIGDQINKNTIKNGIILCNVVQNVFRTNLTFNKSPKNDEDSIDNFNTCLKFLCTQSDYVDQVPDNINQVSEEIGWKILWKVMNNCSNFIDIRDSGYLIELEHRVILWLKVLEILPGTAKDFIDLLPFFRNGVLLGNIINSLIPGSIELIDPITDDQCLENISKALEILQKCPDMSQKYTNKHTEIFNGETECIIGIIEDLYELSYKISKSQAFTACTNPPETSKKDPKDEEKIEELENWLNTLGIGNSGLQGDKLKDFRNGLKLYHIVKALTQTQIEGINRSPKTLEEASSNIKKVLNFLYSIHNFPLKYNYYDDQILKGDGTVIRSLLIDIKKIFSL